jgi:hypothetical protein
MPEEPDPRMVAQRRPGDAPEISQNRELIKKSRESIKDGQRHFADSVDRLVESRNLLRRIGSKWTTTVGLVPTGQPGQVAVGSGFPRSC